MAKNVDNITALMDAQFQTAGYAGVSPWARGVVSTILGGKFPHTFF